LENFIIHNGNLIDVSKSGLSPENRAFLFGDGIFESIKVVNGKPLFVSTHHSRITEALRALRIDDDKHLTAEKLEQDILSLIDKCGIKEGARVRLTVFRNPGGFYLPEGSGFSYVITLKADSVNFFQLNEEGLVVDLYPDIKKQITPLAYYKTLNCQNYILASIYAKERNLHDALMINENNNIIESTNSNLFIVSNGVLYTPAVSDGCVGGTMRMHIINLALENSIKVYECSLNPQNLLAADELFLTNAIRGIQWVSAYRMKRYFHKLSGTLLAKLNERVAAETA
jgi:branched-subunit amino acid aminotransferase/4-amino-4-deoxychorismate lyase